MNEVFSKDNNNLDNLTKQFDEENTNLKCKTYKSLNVIAKELIDSKPEEYQGKVKKERLRNELAIEKWLVKCDQLLIIYLCLYRRHKQKTSSRAKGRLLNFSPSRIAKLYGNSKFVQECAHASTNHFFKKIFNGGYDKKTGLVHCSKYEPRTYMAEEKDFRVLLSKLFTENKPLVLAVMDTLFSPECVAVKTISSKEDLIKFMMLLITVGQ